MKKKTRNQSPSCGFLPPFNLIGRRKLVCEDDKDDYDNNNNDRVDDDDDVDDVFDTVVHNLIKNKKNIIVLVGAGLSTSVGIPDFRSKDMGLYNTINVNELGLGCPEDLFCIEFFKENPTPFYKFAKQLYHNQKLDHSDNNIDNKIDNNNSDNDDSNDSSSDINNSLVNQDNDDDDKKNRKKYVRSHDEENREDLYHRSQFKHKHKRPNNDNNNNKKKKKKARSSMTTTNIEPSDSHRLLALLEEKKMLLRVYTQNIDGLESVAGVSNSKIVYCHGSLQYATCMKCSNKINTTTIPTRRSDSSTTTGSSCDNDDDDHNANNNDSNDDISRQNFITSIEKGMVPYCKVPSKKCHNMATNNNNNNIKGTRSSSRTRKRPRSLTNNNIEDNGDHDKQQRSPNDCCGGILKPGITFFGETLSSTVSRKIEMDRSKADALIVIGTSLSVAPISKVIEYLPSTIPRILINRTMVHLNNDNNKKNNSKINNCKLNIHMNNKNNNDNDDRKNNDNDDNDSRRSSTTIDIANFRRIGYAFDSYLLGDCDDVTRAIGQTLNSIIPDKNKQKKKVIPIPTTKMKEKTMMMTASKLSPTPARDNSIDSSSNRYASDASARLLTTVLRQNRKRIEDTESDNKSKNDSKKKEEGRSCSQTATATSTINIGTIPPDRVILFPGAIISSLAEEETSQHYEEIVHCDGCSQQININNTDGNDNSYGSGNGNDTTGTIYKCSICFDYDLCSKCYLNQSKMHFNGQHIFTH